MHNAWVGATPVSRCDVTRYDRRYLCTSWCQFSLSAFAICISFVRFGMNRSIIPLAHGATGMTGRCSNPMYLANAPNSCPLNVASKPALTVGGIPHN